MSTPFNISLSTIAFQTGPISARPPPHKMINMPTPNTTMPMPNNTMPGPNDGMRDHSKMINIETVATHTFATAPPLDVILVPGGIGDFAVVGDNNTEIEDFLKERYGELDYLLSVCTGAVSLARAGLLKNRRATTNKKAWSWVTQFGSNVSWVPTARWVEDGNVWTSSGVGAGIDMMYAFLRHVYGPETIDEIINRIEYVPHTDSTWDPFSVIQGVPGADKERSMTDCVRPIGY
jgi:transcriptional regulator GlxA family with amidase domain